MNVKQTRILRNSLIGLIIFIGIALLYSLLLKAESVESQKIESSLQSSTPLIHTMKTTQDYAVAGTVIDLVKLADYIVVGQYGTFVESWEMGKDYYSQVYTFRVSESMKGEVGETIEVAIPHYITLKTNLKENQYRADIELQNYNEPELDQTYILFLGKALTRDVYTPTSVPFQIRLDDGKATLLTNKSDGMKMIQMTSDEYLQLQLERIDLTGIDKVTGLEIEELKMNLMSAINNETVSAER